MIDRFGTSEDAANSLKNICMELFPDEYNHLLPNYPTFNKIFNHIILTRIPYYTVRDFIVVLKRHKRNDVVQALVSSIKSINDDDGNNNRE